MPQIDSLSRKIARKSSITVEQVAREIFGKSYRSLSVYVQVYVRRETRKRRAALSGLGVK